MKAQWKKGSLSNSIVDVSIGSTQYPNGSPKVSNSSPASSIHCIGPPLSHLNRDLRLRRVLVSIVRSETIDSHDKASVAQTSLTWCLWWIGLLSCPQPQRPQWRSPEKLSVNALMNRRWFSILAQKLSVGMPYSSASRTKRTITMKTSHATPPPFISREKEMLWHKSEPQKVGLGSETMVKPEGCTCSSSEQLERVAKRSFWLFAGLPPLQVHGRFIRLRPPYNENEGEWERDRRRTEHGCWMGVGCIKGAKRSERWRLPRNPITNISSSNFYHDHPAHLHAQFVMGLNTYTVSVCAAVGVTFTITIK